MILAYHGRIPLLSKSFMSFVLLLLAIGTLECGFFLATNFKGWESFEFVVNCIWCVFRLLLVVYTSLVWSELPRGTVGDVHELANAYAIELETQGVRRELDLDGHKSLPDLGNVNGFVV